MEDMWGTGYEVVHVTQFTLTEIWHLDEAHFTSSGMLQNQIATYFLRQAISYKMDIWSPPTTPKKKASRARGCAQAAEYPSLQCVG